MKLEPLEKKKKFALTGPTIDMLFRSRYNLNGVTFWVRAMNENVDVGKRNIQEHTRIDINIFCSPAWYRNHNRCIKKKKSLWVPSTHIICSYVTSWIAYFPTYIRGFICYRLTSFPIFDSFRYFYYF